jgi:hypothetical protein
MHCDTLIDPACRAVGHLVQTITGTAAGDILGGIAQAIREGVRWIVENTATWWVRIPSPDLAAEPAVAHLQQWLLPVTVAVAVAAVITAGARMAIMRRANPLLDVTGGLLALAAATTLGTIVPALLVQAGDAWSTWVLQVSTGGQFAQRLTNALSLGGDAASVLVVIFGIIAILLSIVQAGLMLFRQAALVILAGVLPLAAAGSIAPMTRTWIRKVTTWMLALIFYKPAAAAVYATAFTMIGSGRDPRTVLMGFVMLLLSVVMLPALMRFFTWTTGAIAGPGGGGQLLGAAAVGAVAVGAMRSSASGGAQDQAAYTNARLGAPPGGAPPGGSSPSGGAPTSGGSGGESAGGSGGSNRPPAGAPSASGADSADPASGGQSGAPSGADGAAISAPRPGSGTAPPTGAPPSTAASAADAAQAGSARGAIDAGVAAAGVAAAAARMATGAMEPEDQG